MHYCHERQFFHTDDNGWVICDDHSQKYLAQFFARSTVIIASCWICVSSKETNRSKKNKKSFTCSLNRSKDYFEVMCRTRFWSKIGKLDDIARRACNILNTRLVLVPTASSFPDPTFRSSNTIYCTLIYNIFIRWIFKRPKRSSYYE